MAVGGFDQTLAPSRKKAPLKGLVLEHCSSVKWVDLVATCLVQVVVVRACIVLMHFAGSSILRLRFIAHRVDAAIFTIHWTHWGCWRLW